MSKKFSIVNIKDEELFYKGYIDESFLIESDSFLDILSSFWPNETENVVISHCLLDVEDADKIDIEDDELDEIIENFDSIVDVGRIYIEEEIKYDVVGLRDEEIERLEREEQGYNEGEVVVEEY